MRPTITTIVSSVFALALVAGCAPGSTEQKAAPERKALPEQKIRPAGERATSVSPDEAVVAMEKQLDNGMTASYDKDGRLVRIASDRNGDGRPETWAVMDGTRLVRLEADTDGDGRIDRWEYYAADGDALEKVGTSSANDGRPDTWLFAGTDGAVARVESDTNRDGRVDKWETYRNGVLESAAFDLAGRGTPDRRLVYRPDGSLVRIEELKPGR